MRSHQRWICHAELDKDPTVRHTIFLQDSIGHIGSSGALSSQFHESTGYQA